MSQSRSADFYLASASPRRSELLRQVGYHFGLLRPDVPEVRAPGESPDAFVRRLALEKARAGRALAPLDRPVMGADTAVVLDDSVLGKPQDAADATAMLRALAGRAHRVLTAVALVDAGREDVVVSETFVRMRAIAPDELAAYVASGECDDKAGAYAIQGRAAIFVERIDGSYSGVMGLPLFETAQLLARFGIAGLGT